MKLSKELLRQEFIGLEAIISSPAIHSPLRGRIVDETRNMLRLEKGGREWLVGKRGARIRLKLQSGEVQILGDWILGAPEDRIKKRMRRLIA